MQTTLLANMLTFMAKPMVKVYSEQQHLSRTAPIVSIINWDFVLIQESQSPLFAMFCVECHAATAYARDEQQEWQQNEY
jgi:hypothetical protein